MEDFTAGIIDELAQKLVKEKERLLKERLRAILGYDLDIEAECKRRFPRISRTLNSSDKSEHYYWDDRSDDGRLIISFYEFNSMLDYISPCSSIMCGLKYK